MRILLDQAKLSWETAWDLTVRTLAYTNHTLLPEALEKWPVELFETLLPRHLQIIYEINARFLAEVRGRVGDDGARLERMSLIEERPVRSVRMAHLAIVGSHSTNGVSELHSDLVRTQLVPDFAALFPERFNNKTNGVTPRRWLLLANPELSALITGAIGDGWITDLERLRGLAPLAEDAAFRAAFRAAKSQAKARFARWLAESSGIVVDPDTIFDCQIKRIHEYKRQLLNVLHIVLLYQRLRAQPARAFTPRTFFFAGKAAPAYHLAKLIIKLIHNVAARIDAEPAMRDRIKVVFLPDYSVSLAERLIPAADVSEQISTAGFEASGTSNMKFMMNGALTIGTRDGATVEMAPGGRRGELLPVRSHRRRGGGKPRLVPADVALLERRGDPADHRRPVLRRIQPRRAGRVRTDPPPPAGGGRLLHAPGRPARVCGGAGAGGGALRRSGAPGRARPC